jgi:RimJ/RimL family protein N-acetyltransferase
MINTERLTLAPFTLDDDVFILRLLNEPSFIDNIADRGVRTLVDARAYLSNGPMASYAANGFGLWRASLRASGTPIGMCGLIRRAGLADVDLGYALLPEYTGQGYAIEAARASLEVGHATLGLARIIAIVSPGNERSVRVLEKLGFAREGTTRLPNDTLDLLLFAHDAARGR